jgi:hypothetical protein
VIDISRRAVRGAQIIGTPIAASFCQDRDALALISQALNNPRARGKVIAA